MKRNLVVVLESKGLWYLQGNVSCQMYCGFWKCHRGRCQTFAILTRPEVLFWFLLFYQLYTSRLKYLRAWHEYADSKRIQEDMKLLADKHRRLTLLKGRFQKWKKRVCCLFASREFFVGMTVNSIMFIIFQCTSKKKLQALIGQWQKKAFGKWHSHVKKK